LKQMLAEKDLPVVREKPLWFCGECGLGGNCLNDLIRHVEDEHGLESWVIGGGVIRAQKKEALKKTAGGKT